MTEIVTQQQQQQQQQHQQVDLPYARGKIKSR